MCIVLLTTAHPDFPLILLNNRDEFLHRPTLRASFWPPPNSHIFSGRDLARPERGTWLGVTRSGRLAVLTNFREPAALAVGQKSRGAMISTFLTSSLLTEEFLRGISEDAKSAGGFSMMCGTIRSRPRLAVVSNRSKAAIGEEGGVSWIGGERGGERSGEEGEKEGVYGLSNALFEDPRPWPKVVLGRKLLAEAVETARREHDSEERLVERLFQVLNYDTLPLDRRRDTYETVLHNLRYSVFIPAFVAAPEAEAEAGTDLSAEDIAAAKSAREKGTAVENIVVPVNGVAVNGHPAHSDRPSLADQAPEASLEGKSEEKTRWWSSTRLYGTQSQTVILVDRRGRLKFVERTLYDEHARPVPERERDVVREFQIEGWEDGEGGGST